MAEKLNQQAKAAKDPMIHVALNRQREGIFVCPACKNSVSKDLSKVANASRAIRINCKCRCGHVYQVLVDRRSNIRESVNFVGLFHCDTDTEKAKKGLIKIIDISLSGLQFSLNTAPDFTIGDRITVEFTLDDLNRSKVREEGIVRWTHANKVGVQFENSKRHNKLGLYLFQ